MLVINQCKIFEAKFAEATNHCYQEFEKRQIAYEEVKEVITGTFYPGDTCKREGHTDNIFVTDEDIDDVFQTLTQYGLWDYQNYLLLKAIITHFASDNAQLCGVLRMYEDDLTQYQKKTMTLDICHLHDKQDSLNGTLQELKVELSRSAGDLCLYQVTVLSKSLANQFSLDPAVVLLKKVTKCPLTVMWLVPMILNMSDLIPSNQKWLEENNIVQVVLEGKVLYREQKRNVSV